MGSWRREWLARSAARDLVVLLVLTVLAFAALPAALLQARSALIDLGPNDDDAVRGFRSEWERDGLTRFRWTLQAANLAFPLRATGDGFRLRLRVRRHLIEPAAVRLYVEGRNVGEFTIQADPKVAYRIEEFTLPRLEGRHPFVLSIESSSASPRPLGVALDWVELERSGAGRFHLPIGSSLAVVLIVLLAYGVPRAAGAGPGLAASLAGLLLAGAATGAAVDPVALERIARLGLAPFALTGAVALLCVRLPRVRGWLAIESRSEAGLLVTLALLAVAVRAILLLHPRFFYPDVRIHGLFALILARRGPVAFLSQFIPNQFRYSLGLQEVGGHWYAFPYPPAFYALAAPFVSLLHYRGEAAVSSTAAIVNSLEVLLVFAIARHLGLASRVARAGAAFLTLLPLFLVRLSLAYFPAIVGHALDALVLAFLAARYAALERRRNATLLAALLAMSLLTYTQGLLNFGVLLALFVALDAWSDRTSAARRRQWMLVGCGLIAALVSFAAFYVRYVPMITAMARNEAVPEESGLLEARARMQAVDGEAVPEEPDPYAGPNLDLLRGVRKAAWRLWVFYGPFAPVLVVGVALLIPSLEGYRRRLVIAWAATYVVLNLASGSLPGPNLVRYNKDLEIVAPLCALGLGWVVTESWHSRRRLLRGLAVGLSVGWLVFAVGRAYAALASRLFLER